MNKISSIDFYNQWCKTLQERRTEFITIGFNSKAVTSFMLKEENSIINTIAKEFNLNSCCEYYSLDAILYANEDKITDKESNGLFLSEIKVAFEHENFFNSGLYQEISHLLITNADLKVLVTYPGGYDTKKEITYLYEIIKRNSKSDYISSEENFLLILGNEIDCTWEGFIYKEDGWKKI